MIDLKKAKTIFKFVDQGPLNMRHLRVTGDNITGSDLTTVLQLRGSTGLSNKITTVKSLDMNNVEICGEKHHCVTVETDKPREKHHCVTVETDKLFNLINYVSNDETRPHLGCICIDTEDVVACNGHILNSFKPLGETRVCDKDKHYLIPGDSIKVLKGVVKYFKLDVVDIYLSENFAQIITDDFIWVSFLVKREYVRWQLIVSAKFKHSFELSSLPSYKDVKHLLNPKTNCVAIVGDGKNIELIIDYDNGQDITKIKFPIGISDVKFAVGFNMRYLDILIDKKKNFVLKYNSELTPAMIGNAVIMPMKL